MKDAGAIKVLNISRRSFVVGSGGLALTLALAPPGFAAPALDLNPFVRIGNDNRITLFAPCSELGQGSLSGLAMILAEELDAPWDLVGSEIAPLNEVYRNPANGMQGTGDSRSVREFYLPLRNAGASARDMLIRAAASRWNVRPSECETLAAQVRHIPSNRVITYGELTADAADLAPPDKPELKSPNNFKLIGSRSLRKDTGPKVDGTAQFGIDVVLPNMIIAAVKMAPVFGAEVESFDGSMLEGRIGFHSVQPIPGGIAVLADRYWRARKYLDEVNVTFGDGATSGLTTTAIDDGLQTALSQAEALPSQGRGNKAAFGQTQGDGLSADYYVPHLAHAPMEPMGCVADVRSDRCDIWGSIQNQDRAAKVAEVVTGLERNQIRVHTTYAGGAFGRRSVPDYIVQAVSLSKAVGIPVKVIWSREDDMRHDHYRPAAALRLSAKLGDKTGKPEAMTARIAASTAGSSLSRKFPDYYGSATDEQIAHWRSTEIGNTPYAIPQIAADWVNTDTGVPVGYWRSVDHSYTVFAIESFIDEAAAAAGIDPLLYRLELLQDAHKIRRVVEMAAEKADWTTPPLQGRGRGIAWQAGFGSPVAQVAEVSIEDGRIRVHRITCAIDCGIAVAPDQVEAQMEGSIVFGLTAALYGRIDLENGAVVQSNFHDYQMVTLADMPQIDVHIIESTKETGGPPGGVGEPGTPPVAPAVANAVYALTGQRLRRLPLRLS